MTDDTKELRAEFEQRSSEELVSILRDHDEDEWRPEVFDVVASVLESRGVSAVASPPSPNPTADGSAPVVVSTTPQPRLWFEIIAVLCIAVLPDVSHAVYWSLFAPTEQSSLVYSYAAIGLRGLFVSVPVLYVISLSRMPERFGLVRVSVGDLAGCGKTACEGHSALA